ncbi:MAG: glutaminase A [Gammaproteobacteria bacterium RIFCSPLOWO2_02_FULL_61_13]|nr:MAG: glutaminase A [Gammaproteobacteria bacterium RIFCSPLOWO2_02_FULL_61_13]
MQSPILTYLQVLHSRLSDLKAGQVASYIPELTKANPEWFGISVMTTDGAAYCVGDADQEFTIQSISKPFVYATALADMGNGVAGKVGVEPTGDAFHSISLDPQSGAPLNPMINAGAITSTGLVKGESPEAQWRRIKDSLSAFMGRSVSVDEQVYRSESETGFRNRAIAWMLKNSGIIDGDPMAVLENYFRQCSILVSCRDLACMAATLANNGVHAVTGQRVLTPDHVERVLSVMLTCGMYNYAGSWMYEVGIPAKSGVSGGIIAVLPGSFGIGVFAPRLDEKGNSVRGVDVCKRMSQDFNLHVLTNAGNANSVLGRVYTGAEAPSRRIPSPELRAYLDEHAHRIKYLCLNGFLAVDGIEFVIRRMQELAPVTHSFILEMHQVSGISDSAALLLNEAIKGFGDDGIATVFSRMHGRAGILAPMRRTARNADRAGAHVSVDVTQPLRLTARNGERGFLTFEDNDLAAEWCENRLFGETTRAPASAALLADSPLFKGAPDTLIRQMETASESRVFAAGERVLEAGEKVDGRFFFVESGRVSILVPLHNGGHLRIASLGPGMTFGEMALLGQTIRSASVHSETEVRCRVLKVGDFNRISDQHPLLKITFLENLARDMADRLQGANKWIAALA